MSGAMGLRAVAGIVEAVPAIDDAQTGMGEILVQPGRTDEGPAFRLYHGAIAHEMIGQRDWRAMPSFAHMRSVDLRASS